MKCGRLLGAAQTLKFREAAKHECEGQIVVGSKRCAWETFVVPVDATVRMTQAVVRPQKCAVYPRDDNEQAVLWQLASPVRDTS